jgi:glutaredoxin
MNSTVEIYTKDNCIYCEKVKQLLEAKSFKYTEQKLDKDFTREFIKEKFPTAKTFPIVIVDGYRIGGYTEFANMVNLEEQKQNSSKLLNEG